LRSDTQSLRLDCGAHFSRANVLLGSFNLDPLSLANLEVLVEVQDPTTVSKTEAWVRARIEASHRVGAADCAGRFRVA
jgi:phosphatidylserine/phosphatidylglycerophosphate/cardiolipin synthase-like enzyme